MLHESASPFRVGVIGCGDIARKAYFPFARDHARAFIITACCDLQEAVARECAHTFGISKVYATPDALIEDPEIDVVLNLTPPSTHAPLNLQALRAGKHAYSEKPFALSRKEGQQVLEESARRGLQVGCAPDTVLGPGIQSCRSLIDAGAIGEPRYARIQFICAGHEHWHPNPAFFYQKGGGPLLDMGPYYLTTIVHLFGPVKRVMGRAVRISPERTIKSEPLKGTVVRVECPTHYTGSLEMASGVLVQATFSFDYLYGSGDSILPEVYGTEGTLRCSDPNTFEGSPQLSRSYGQGNFQVESPSHRYPAGRGIGLEDMVEAIRNGRKPRCSGDLAYHVLDVMLAFEDSEREQRSIEVASTCPRPPAIGLDGSLAVEPF